MENEDKHIKEFSKTYFLTAGECNPQGEMPLQLVVERIIEISTLHANAWAVGYDNLIKRNEGWVLSRVTVEMKRYPTINESYTVTTWIEGYNRHFSQRNVAITDASGEVVGEARTVWMAINFATREGVDISQLSYINSNVSSRRSGIEPQSRLRPVTQGRTASYTFQYADCDFNRHVNTVRYLELLMNQFAMQKYDDCVLRRMEIAFLRETRYADTALVRTDDTNPDDCKMSIDVDGASHCKARFVFAPRTETKKD